MTTDADRLLQRVEPRGAVPLDRLGTMRSTADDLIAAGQLATHKDVEGTVYVYVPYVDPYAPPKPRLFTVDLTEDADGAAHEGNDPDLF